MAQKNFRQCVVGLFINDSGKVLVGERSDAPGAWQLPQGGIEKGENPEAALRREMTEELGSGDFKIIKRAAEKCRYEFPPELQAAVAKKFCGQEQTWFLLRFEPNTAPNLSKSDGEFSAIKWVDPATTISEIIVWKRLCYEHGFQQLGIRTH